MKPRRAKDEAICCQQLPLRAYLVERRRVLSYQVSAINGQIRANERELADVTASLEAIAGDTQK